jgi:6-phosphogluconolactonase
VDKTGRAVIVANYGSGSAAVLPLEADGRVKPASSFVQHSGSSLNPKRQSGPHAHSVNLSADNRFAIVADLGLDQVLVYKFDAANGAIEPNQPPFFAVAPGSGPRHFAFHPNGRYGYVINELASTVTAMSWDAARGVFRELGTVSTLPKGFTGGSTTAEVQVHPSGRFLYGSNRGHNSIAAFAIGPKGTLKPAGHTPSGGEIPRNFGIDPTGQFLIAANQKTDSVVLFRIDQKTGALTPTGARFELGAPVCVRFLPAQ